jgi:hypothetical protein
LDCPIKGKKGNQEILAILEFKSSFHGMKEARIRDGS